MAIERGAPGPVSGEAASTTPLASAARYFAGTVRRCLASRVCSKVPWKFKGSHEVLANFKPGWLGGRSPATRVPHASPTIPHFLPLCNSNLIPPPTTPGPRPLDCGNARPYWRLG
jgi:hypothetical protein